MNPDDEVCCCYHVSLRKLLNYARREKPMHASQLSDCLGAGTGCGWCIPVLKSIHQAVTGNQNAPDLPATASELDNAEQYAASRKAYIQSGRKHVF